MLRSILMADCQILVQGGFAEQDDVGPAKQNACRCYATCTRRDRERDVPVGCGRIECARWVGLHDLAKQSTLWMMSATPQHQFREPLQPAVLASTSELKTTTSCMNSHICGKI